MWSSNEQATELSRTQQHVNDSRGGWAEQVLVDEVAFVKEDFGLGPGSYSPEAVKGHVPTVTYDRLWTLDKRKPKLRPASQSESINYFGYYGFSGTPQTYTRRSSPQPQATRTRAQTTGSLNIGGRRRGSVNWTEFSPHQPALDPIYYDGKARTIKGKMHEKLEVPTKLALPDYDVMFDSYQIKAKPQNGKFFVQRRPELFPVISFNESSRSPPVDDRPWRTNAVTAIACNETFLSRRRAKSPIVVYETISKYNKPRSPVQDLNPFAIDRCIKANIFSRPSIKTNSK